MKLMGLSQAPHKFTSIEVSNSSLPQSVSFMFFFKVHVKLDRPSSNKHPSIPFGSGEHTDVHRLSLSRIIEHAWLLWMPVRGYRFSDLFWFFYSCGWPPSMGGSQSQCLWCSTSQIRTVEVGVTSCIWLVHDLSLCVCVCVCVCACVCAFIKVSSSWKCQLRLCYIWESTTWKVFVLWVTLMLQVEVLWLYFVVPLCTHHTDSHRLAGCKHFVYK